MACKPGSVLCFHKAMAIPLGRSLPNASRDPPGRWPGNRPCTAPIWSCSRWGLPCRVRCRTRGALLPHRFTLASVRKSDPIGGLFSVALSLGSPPPDVIRHRISVEPGLSSRLRLRLRRGEPMWSLPRRSPQGRRRAAIRPSDAGGAIAPRRAEPKRRAVRSSAVCR